MYANCMTKTPQAMTVINDPKKLNKVLDTFSVGKVNVAIVYDTRRAKEEIYFPVKYRVTFNRKQVYYPSMDLTEEEWSELLEAWNKAIRKKELKRIKDLVSAGFKRITDIVDDLAEKEGFSLERLDARLSGGIKDSIYSAFDDRIASLTKDGKIGSSVWYSCALNSIQLYAKNELKGKKDLKFADITPAWLKNYHSYLKKLERSDTTISMYMRALRAIINSGMAKGIITQSQYPFTVKKNGKYTIPEGLGTKRALTEKQLIKVFNYSIIAADEKWRDLWVFSFYCNGANMNDILRFKYSNIIDNGIEWYRKKTISQDKKKRIIRAIITEEMQLIMDTYSNPDHRPDNYIFPYLRPRLTPTEERNIIKEVIHIINNKMHKIGQALGIGDISTYWARHTWASLSRRGGVSLYAISKGMGHKNLETTQLYLDSLPDDELINNAAKLPRRNNNNGEARIA